MLPGLVRRRTVARRLRTTERRLSRREVATSLVWAASPPPGIQSNKLSILILLMICSLLSQQTGEMSAVYLSVGHGTAGCQLSSSFPTNLSSGEQRLGLSQGEHLLFIAHILEITYISWITDNSYLITYNSYLISNHFICHILIFS